jgi:hypothetical protein
MSFSTAAAGLIAAGFASGRCGVGFFAAGFCGRLAAAFDFLNVGRFFAGVIGIFQILP